MQFSKSNKKQTNIKRNKNNNNDNIRKFYLYLTQFTPPNSTTQRK